MRYTPSSFETCVQDCSTIPVKHVIDTSLIPAELRSKKDPFEDSTFLLALQQYILRMQAPKGRRGGFGIRHGLRLRRMHKTREVSVSRMV